MRKWKRDYLFIIISICIILVFGATYYQRRVADPQLEVKTEKRSIKYKRSELLKRSDVRQIQIQNDPTYPGRTMVYTSIPIYALFEGIEVPQDSVLLFRSADGFSAPISQERLLNRSSKYAIAYLAVEKEDDKWPKLPNSSGNVSAGPFYVVWTNPGASHIGQEEWPYQVISFEVKKPLKSLYPRIFPRQDISQDHPIYRGFQVFIKTCFTCHTLNLEGSSRMGPDLNLPMSPTEYFKDSALKKLIRNPQDLRHWREGKMPGFSSQLISDAELEDLILYLNHMAQNRMK